MTAEDEGRLNAEVDAIGEQLRCITARLIEIYRLLTEDEVEVQRYYASQVQTLHEAPQDSTQHA